MGSEGWQVGSEGWQVSSGSFITTYSMVCVKVRHCMKSCPVL